MKGRYRVKISGRHHGKVGMMVGRFCDSSTNDIRLIFSDGSESWFSFGDVEYYVDHSSEILDQTELPSQ